MNPSLAIAHLEQITLAIRHIQLFSERIGRSSKEPAIELLAHQIKSNCEAVYDEIEYTCAAISLDVEPVAEAANLPSSEGAP